MYNPYNWEIKPIKKKEELINEIAQVDCAIITTAGTLRDLEIAYDEARAKIEEELQYHEKKKEDLWKEYRKLYI